MIHRYLLLLLGLAALPAGAQQLSGLTGSNFAGVNGVFANPATIADSRYRFHLLLFTADGHLTNNFYRYNGPGPLLSNLDRIENDSLFSQNRNSRPKLGSAGFDVRGPGFLLRLSPKHSLAFTTRVRGFGQVNALSENITRLFDEELPASQPLTTDNRFNANVNVISEQALSYGRVVLDGETHFLKAGLTFKYITGLGSAHLTSEQLNYEVVPDLVDPAESTLRLNALKARYGYAGLNKLQDRLDAVSDVGDAVALLTGREAVGRGFGLDLGAVYEYRPDIAEYNYTMDGEEGLDPGRNKYKLRVGLALTDIGRVRYRSDGFVYNLTRTNFDITEDSLGNFDDEDLEGSLNRLLDVQPAERSTNLKAGLPTALRLDVDYHLWRKLYANFSLVQGVRGRFATGMRTFSQVSLTPRLEMKWLEVSLPLSLMNNYQNLAYGMMVRLGPVFVGSDNMAPLLKRGDPYGGNVYAGVSLLPLFAGKKRDKDKDGVSNKQDLCRETPGVWSFKGCPDTDSDGIPDSEDLCYTEPGPVALKGCPDADNDGITDKEDGCPKEAGSREFKGCPDTDKDGLPDKDDACPAVAGPAKFQGCPDTDNDGVLDKDDRCPQQPGPVAFAGCPDSDGDGLTDAEDQCPTQAGPVRFRGCPDRDQDGIFDPQDACPDAFGLPSLRGCPDRDLDGVVDPRDNCPDAYGTAENNGCPLVTVVEKRTVVRLTPAETEVLREAFKNLEFQTGKAVLSTTSLQSLEGLADLLVENPNYVLLIQGHTDNVGKAATNLKLSRARATAVRTRLLKDGVPAKQIVAEGYGSARPVATNKTPAGRARNRRVELKIVR